MGKNTKLRTAIKKLPLASSTYALMRLLRGRNARFVSDYSQTSGIGSDLNVTKSLVTALRGLLDSVSVQSMLDIPCGDFVWMQKVNLDGVNYIGADIIEPLILSHQRIYTSPQRTFRCLDIVIDELPQVDLIFCRDCFVHFSHRLLKKAVNNIKRSRSRYLLTTTFPEHPRNNGIVTGLWQPLNLCAPPFNFPPPLKIMNESQPLDPPDKSLALWDVRDLPTF